MIRYVSLKNYKSLVDLQVDFMHTKTKPKKIVLIYGENGIGKSNFATAFYTLNETMRTMSSIEYWKKIIEDINEAKNMDEKHKSMFEKNFRNNFKDIEMIIKDCKTINSTDNMVMEFGFKCKGKDGIYRIEMNENEIVSESLDYILNKNKTSFFNITKDKNYINNGIFKDKNYFDEFKELIDKYWGKHSFLSILSYEIEDKKNGYVKKKISSSLFDVWFFLKTICTKVKGGNHSEFGTIGSTHIKIRDFDRGKINLKYESELNKIEEFLNVFFTSISSDIKKVFYIKEKNEKFVKYKLMVKKLIYNNFVDIDFSLESTGNQNLLELIPYFISVCEGQIVIIDELDTGVHDLLVDNILNNLVEYIKGQLIITTHNTMLIESDIKKENIYVFNVNRNAEKMLVPITNFTGRIHKNINPRKKYLSGVYGGVPIVSTIDFDELIENLE